jgi:hypothetical protein
VKAPGFTLILSQSEKLVSKFASRFAVKFNLYRYNKDETTFPHFKEDGSVKSSCSDVGQRKLNSVVTQLESDWLC